MGKREGGLISAEEGRREMKGRSGSCHQKLQGGNSSGFEGNVEEKGDRFRLLREKDL